MPTEEPTYEDWVIRIRNPKLLRAACNLVVCRNACHELKQSNVAFADPERISLELDHFFEACAYLQDLKGGYEKFPFPSFGREERMKWTMYPVTIEHYSEILLRYIKVNLTHLDKPV